MLTAKQQTKKKMDDVCNISFERKKEHMKNYKVCNAE